jgi:hypothetical protein
MQTADHPQRQPHKQQPARASTKACRTREYRPLSFTPYLARTIRSCWDCGAEHPEHEMTPFHAMQGLTVFFCASCTPAPGPATTPIF